MSEPRRIGSYLTVEESGRLRSRANSRNIRSPWSEAVDALVAAYLEKFAADLHSIYVRGSVAAGFAIEGVSDVDSFAVLKPGVAWSDTRHELRNWQREVDIRLRFGHPFVAGVETALLPFEQVTTRGDVFSFILATEAACVHGSDLTTTVEHYAVGPEIAFQTRFFGSHLTHFLSAYPHEPEAERPEFATWILRRFLRLGMELVMTEEGRYTRDLFLCYESFSKHYPAQERMMRRSLEMALSPEQGEDAYEFIRNFGFWLLVESERKLRAWGYERDTEGLWRRSTRS